MKLTSYQQNFVMHFGEMGSRWGINRTVGQLYALLFISQEPINADQMAESLGMSRSNVSMGLKELQSWHLVRLKHFPGDRKEYFSAPEDIWAIFQTLAEQRRQREIDPTITMLRDALLEPVSESHSEDPDHYARQRMGEMLELIEMLTDWFAEVQRLDRATLEKLMRLGGGVRRVLEVGDRFKRKRPSSEAVEGGS
ncbi:MAG: GbsR/MarR family transcriptional regulator [Gammaproteobacteria bacterium]